MRNMIALTVTAAALAAFTTVYAQTAPAAPPNDAQIAQIVVTADSVDVDYGNLAVKKTKNAEVKAFAETMIRDHTAVNDKALALVKKLHVTPEANGTSASLTKGADATRVRLSHLRGAAFDRAYIDNEVAYHKTVNGALESTLIPNAKNPELKSLLETGLSLFREHQAHAEQVAKELK